MDTQTNTTSTDIDRGTIAGSLRWNEMRICENLKLGEKGGGLPINERIEIGNRIIKKLTQLVGALESSKTQ